MLEKQLTSNTDENIGIIPELYVKPQFRRQGIAKKLCKEAIKQINAEGLEKVQLNVFSGNQVKQLYEKLGFF